MVILGNHCGPLYHLVVAASILDSSVAFSSTKQWGIGIDGRLPWHLPLDLARFKKLTSGGCVLMGRKTWDSIPQKFKPLPKRLNIILTTSDLNEFRTKLPASAQDSVLLAGSLAAADKLIRERQIPKVFVIGGADLYYQCLSNPQFSHVLHLTRVYSNAPCDTYFPSELVNSQQFQIVSLSDRITDKHADIEFAEYHRKSSVVSAAVGEFVAKHEEYQYLDLIREILRDGVTKSDRTGTGTKSVFGRQMRWSLREGRFPLLTTKRVFWRGVAEEMLWFVRGSTDSKLLAARDVRIWNDNGSREFLDKLGFHDREEGDLGPVYGFQWRHFGAEYSNAHQDYTGQGIDQIAEVIRTLRENPNDRRMIVSAWNPAALSKMALPPCHMFCQFYVANGELSCQMYQRSCDMGLGVPFNIASYALLTTMVAHVVGLKLGEFVHVLGDAHVYSNHFEALEEQLKRTPREFPTLRIIPRKDLNSIDDFRFEDFELSNYNPHGPIKMKMAV